MAQGANHKVPTISTHVLDTERGMPAAGIHVTLYRIADDGRPLRLTQALTDTDGRVADLLDRPLTAGDYRLEFALTQSWMTPRPERRHQDPFFRRSSVDLRVTDTSRSYHVPLLLSPYSMTTYRGS